ncbi:1-acyl-sn-glycerol-3-phosphate acyltransferase [Cellulophaga sp. HaHaR_3_176]|uniref:lysophospholipid acyltransferase family protein n=1 Tax=Cellulophaga sp. HaHaR_3_176 TaxID=1942464 RepID=UPI001C200238|nr:lysophospholipid acyltransferase family protein [Cellulophaga sp. HaHaR_3_176]QWX83784.1 1-acyl-sn-glycerol-3-phosphate acyltransferase [Cellulophaga sp. HaHaR_3_176]
MQKLIAYPLSAFYLICFGLTLLFFHPIQWLANNLFGYPALKRVVSILNLTLMRCSHIIGTRFSFNNSYTLPTNRPLIIVANHQSMLDIPPIIWWMRKNHPKFVSKIELGKGIPSVSYNLVHGGSVLIDRKDSKQALSQIIKLGKYIETHQRSAVIFPEGTRSRTGQPKPFQTTGLKLLMKNAPSALIVPISINNSWKTLRYGKFPNGLGSHITLDVHQPIENRGDIDELIVQIEKVITNGVYI